MNKLFSEETLTHYGIQGQKKGVRRWQLPDGRFNEEGKERYFGKSEKQKHKGDIKISELFNNSGFSVSDSEKNYNMKVNNDRILFVKKDSKLGEDRTIASIPNMKMVNADGKYTKEYIDYYNKGKNIIEKIFSDVK